jgi:hypothetical protein
LGFVPLFAPSFQVLSYALAILGHADQRLARYWRASFIVGDGPLLLSAAAVTRASSPIKSPAGAPRLTAVRQVREVPMHPFLRGFPEEPANTLMARMFNPSLPKNEEMITQGSQCS